VTSLLASAERTEGDDESRAGTAVPRIHLSPVAWSIVVLVAIPTIVFAGADAFGGHLLLNGDNLIQSYPLRVLVGSDIRNGVLPSWDPWIWSGTPLLAGLNAGAFYPATLLFAVFSPHVAWVIGEIIIFSSIGVGTCLFFNESGISPLAAFLGAFVFTFGGAIATQAAVHTDMADGLASLPWILLAIRRIAVDGRWRWSVLLGLAFALTILAGAPEAILDIFILGVVFAVVRISIDRGSWSRLLTRAAVAGILAVGLTAALWVPALHFIATSQRANSNISFASENSFPIPAAIFGFIPYLEGGYGLFSQPVYFGRSNLGELAFYVGILPLIAVFVMWTRSWRERLPRGEQRCWYIVLAVGLVLAIAGGTPLEHVVYHIPYYGKQRDPGRNIVDVDLAASALFAWWIDGGSRREQARTPVTAAFFPIWVVVAVGTWFAVSPSTLWRAMRIFPPPSSARASTGDAIALAAALALVGGLIAFARGRWSRNLWLSAVGAFAVVDLALFACGSTYVVGAQAPPVGPETGAVMNLIKNTLSPAGRYGIYDPNHFDPVQLQDVGEPDVNILDDIKSFSGYGAIVDATYANDTATHVRANFNQYALQTGEFRPLNVQAVVTVPEEFLLPLADPPGANGSVTPIAEEPGVDPVLPGGSFGNPPHLFTPMRMSPARHIISGGEHIGWFFGTSVHLKSALLAFGSPDRGQLIRVGVIRPSGTIAWHSSQRLGEGSKIASLDLSTTGAIGIIVKLARGTIGPTQLVVQANSRSYLVAGPLAPVITPGYWSDVGGGDRFRVFRSSTRLRAAWVEPLSAASEATLTSHGTTATRAATGSARVVSSSDNSATILVHSSSSALLVWSTAWDNGWRAQLARSSGTFHRITPQRIGFVIGVTVPRGTSTVRFSYRPVGFVRGVEISVLTVIAWILATTGYFIFRRRGRKPAV